MNRTHEITIPGLDHELCVTCGWVPTQYQVNFLNGLIEKERQKNSPRIKVIEQIEQQLKTDSWKKRQHQESMENVQQVKPSPVGSRQ